MKLYTTVDELAAREVLDVVDVPEGYRLAVDAVADAISEWHEELNADGIAIADRCGYVVSAEYRNKEEDGDDSAAFWDLIEEHTHPYPDLCEEIITGDSIEGHWSATIEWRPLPAVGLDPTADRLDQTTIVWQDVPPARIGRSRAAHGAGYLVEGVVSLAGAHAMTFTPEQVTDPDAVLDVGQYRLSDVLLDGEPAELPTVSAAEFHE